MVVEEEKSEDDGAGLHKKVGSFIESREPAQSLT